MKIDDSLFLKIAGFVLSIVSFGAISAHKITEHGREINAIKKKLYPEDIKHQLVTVEDVERQLQTCGLSHQATTENIFKTIDEIKQTLKEGERLRNRARDERSHHLEGLTDAIKSLEKKIG